MTRKMTRMRFAVVPAMVIASVVFCAVVAAAAINPRTGLYGGTENRYHQGEGAGYFKVAAGSRGKKIVPAKGYPNIVAPTDFICKSGNITASNVLRAKRIPIKAGAFDYSGTPLGSGQAGRTIRVRGTWKTASKIVGSTRTTGGGCNHTVHWTMTAPPPPHYGGPGG